jgi:monoterpene epsilon-lactone hydrolase
MAVKLRAVGVECDLRVWDGLWHVFKFYPIPHAQLSIAEVAEFIRVH